MTIYRFFPPVSGKELTRSDLVSGLYRADVITNFSGSPGLLVKGGDTKSEGCEFESRLRILDGHFHINLLYLYCLFEKNEITKKRPRMAQKQIFAWLHNAEIKHSDWLLK